MNLPTHKCLRCGHEWIPRIVSRPVSCPGCKSPYWDKPRKRCPKCGENVNIENNECENEMCD